MLSEPILHCITTYTSGKFDKEIFKINALVTCSLLRRTNIKNMTKYFVVAAFCKDEFISGHSVVMDGYYAFSRPEVIFCSCTMRTNQEDKLSFIPFLNFDTAILLNISCGSRINIGEVELNCYVNGNLDMIANQKVDIRLVKERPEADTRYCVRIQTGDDNSFVISIYS